MKDRAINNQLTQRDARALQVQNDKRRRQILSHDEPLCLLQETK